MAAAFEEEHKELDEELLRAVEELKVGEEQGSVEDVWCNDAMDAFERQRAFQSQLLTQSGGALDPNTEGIFEFDPQPYRRDCHFCGTLERHFTTRLRQIHNFVDRPHLATAIQRGLRRAIDRVLDTAEIAGDDQLYFTLLSNHLQYNCYLGETLRADEWRLGGQRVDETLQRLSNTLNSNEQFEMDHSFQLNLAHEQRLKLGHQHHAKPTTELARVVTNCSEDHVDVDDVEVHMLMRKALGKLQINEQDKLGFTAMHYAVTQKKLAMVKLLIKYKASVEIKDSLGFTPVFYACGMAANLEIPKYLIEQCKASIVVQTYAGLTCLHCAVYVGAVDVVKLLLKHGADPKGITPFDKAWTSPQIRMLLYKAKQATSCVNCGQAVKKLNRCSRCHVTLYCGRECQKEHWEKGGHKQKCEEGVLAQPSRYPFMTTISNVLKADQPTVSLSGGMTEECTASQNAVPATKSFVVKVQRPMFLIEPKELMVYNVDECVHVWIREETPGYASLVKKITEERAGFSWFFWAERAPSLGEGTVKVFPGQFAPRPDWSICTCHILNFIKKTTKLT